MSTYITIDGGTSSTRVNLLRDKVIIDKVKINIGVKDSIGNREKYTQAIKEAIDTIISKNKDSVIERILASGMITSEFGLCNLPHINVPAGINELHDAIYETTISELSDIPFVFIRGVKNESKVTPIIR